MATDSEEGLSCWNVLIKRSFDLFFSILGLCLTWWIILAASLCAAIDTRNSGFFTQNRVGRYGRIFKVIKIRTMREGLAIDTSVTTSNDLRITPLGRLFRKSKIDEFPQLINIFLGQMSFVGPRPDVPGFADKLCDKDKIILTVRPGITGPATLKYRNEEDILSKQVDPEKYNQEVVFPDKVRLNREYVEMYSFWKDIEYIWRTIFH